MFVIYDRPRDYPHHVIVRKWLVGRRSWAGPATPHPSISAARSSLPPGLIRLARDPSDEPQIVESWV
jgi:hypothetical protein